MINYIIRRLLLIIPTLLLVSIIVFCLVRFIPGDVIDQMISKQPLTTEPLTRVQVESLLGLDVPIYVQYWNWITGIFLHGDFGTSIWTQTPVMSEIANRSRFPLSSA